MVSNSMVVPDHYKSQQKADPYHSSSMHLGHSWSTGKVIDRCDSLPVVAVLSSRYSKDKLLMQMLRCLFFLEAIHNFKIHGQRIPGSLNGLADDLSRNNLDKFLSKMHGHALHASKLSPLLLPCLLHPTMDWTSPLWMQQFSSFVQKEWLTQHTEQPSVIRLLS